MKRGISVGILAGGMSSRMGTDKALIRIGNERIINRILAELGGFSEIIVSAGDNRGYEELGFRTVYDENADVGPMEGIRQVLLNAKEEWVFICAADMPFIRSKLVDHMAGYISSDHDCYVIADEDHIHPLCAIYKKSVLPVIEELIAEKEYRLRGIFSRIRTKYISLENTVFNSRTVSNINTREELFEARKPFVFCVSGYSGSGKTGLIERLIKEFMEDGRSVGVIKHDGHDAFSDLPGSDTDRFKSAGAGSTIVFSDNRYSYSCTAKTTPGDMILLMSSSVDPPDVIIIEGLKDSSYPKVEVIRKEICDKSVCPEETLICIASDCISPQSTNIPVFAPDDVKGIFKCVKDYFGKETGF